MGNVQYIVLILSVYEIAGHTTLRENESLETQDASPHTTSVRISSNLRDVLNQESLVRFSMVQQIQKLAMDVTEIKKDKQTLKRNLNGVMNELQALEINNERLRQENDMLKENDNARETGKGNLGFNMSDILTMQRQISVLENNSDGLAMENANLREKLGFLETTGMMRIRNECRANNQKYHNLLKENDDFKLKLRIMNDTLSQTRELGEKTDNRIQNLKISTEASLNGIREDLKVSQLQLQNISAEIGKVTECEGGWHQFGDSCYQFSDTVVKFNDAVKMCNNVSRGVRLLEIRSLEQENWIILQMEMQGLERTWIGITDSLDEGTYLFLSTGSRVNGTYSNWYKNQPNGGRGENCGVLGLRTYKGWHDYPCDSKQSFICKKARFKGRFVT